jgi:UPF0755 protein
VVAFVVVTLLGIGALASVRLGKWAGERFAADEQEVVDPGGDVEVAIPEGLSARSIGVILAEARVVDSSVKFEAEVRRQNVESQLKAGVYTLQRNMGPAAALVVLLKGPEATNVYKVRIVEGLRIGEILDSLSEQTPYSAAQFEDALLDGSVTSTLLVTQPPTSLTDWEGLLFPDTYELFATAEPKEILQKLASTMETRVNRIDWSRLAELGVTQYEAITIASLIEAEAKLDEDRPLIASVIYNRLKLGMGLDIDATLLYAKGQRGGILTNADKDIDSPYNTYKWAGVPPTPIAAPRLASLQAAANPADTTYLYYVLIDTDGRHGFSETLEEHNAKVAQARADGVIG